MRPESKNPSKPRPGAVILADRVESARASMYCDDPGDKLVVCFLGTVGPNDTVDAEVILEKLGWTRMWVYELSVQMREAEDPSQEWVHRINYRAGTPQDAGRAAIRCARLLVSEEEQNRDALIELRALTVRPMRLGEIDREGRPHNGRGAVMIGWGSESGQSLEDLERKIEERQ